MVKKMNIMICDLAFLSSLLSSSIEYPLFFLNEVPFHCDSLFLVYISLISFNSLFKNGILNSQSLSISIQGYLSVKQD